MSPTRMIDFLMFFSFLLLLLLVAVSFFWPLRRALKEIGEETLNGPDGPESRVRARNLCSLTLICAVLFWLDLSVLLILVAYTKVTEEISEDLNMMTFILISLVFLIVVPTAAYAGGKAINLVGFRRAKRAVWSLVAIWLPILLGMLYLVLKSA